MGKSEKVKTDSRSHLSTFSKHRPKLSARVKTARTCVHRTLLAEPAAITLTRIHRFQFCFLSRRDKVSVLLKIFDDLFTDHFTLKASKCTLDRFVVVYNYKCHLLLTSSRQDSSPVKGKLLFNRLSPKNANARIPKPTH